MKKPVLFEDATMYYNKWVAGQAKGEFATQRVKFKDIVANKTEEQEAQNPNDAKADNVLPYPMPNAIPIIGDLVVGTSNALTMFRTALKNPVMSEDINKKARAETVTIINALKKSLEELNVIFLTARKSARGDS